jgi:hypothetical protein
MFRALRRLSTAAEPAAIKAAESAPIATPTPAIAVASPPRDRSGLRSRLASFFVGVAVTSLYGYVKLREEIVRSAERVDKNVERLVQGSEGLRQQIVTLESRLEKLEKKEQ